MKTRTVGHRISPPITDSASALLLAEACRFNDELHRWSAGGTGFIPKGVYRFKTYAEANRHSLTCIAEGMLRLAKAARAELEN